MACEASQLPVAQEKRLLLVNRKEGRVLAARREHQFLAALAESRYFLACGGNHAWFLGPGLLSHGPISGLGLLWMQALLQLLGT